MELTSLPFQLGKAKLQYQTVEDSEQSKYTTVDSASVIFGDDEEIITHKQTNKRNVVLSVMAMILFNILLSISAMSFYGYLTKTSSSTSPPPMLEDSGPPKYCTTSCQNACAQYDVSVLFF